MLLACFRGCFARILFVPATSLFLPYLVFTLTGAVRDNAHRASPESANFKIRAYWMRHGISCANIIREHAPFGVLTSHLYKDPVLTDCGVENSRRIGAMALEKIRVDNPQWQEKPLLVFSSNLARAMETALYAFPKLDVHPIPYIGERYPYLWDNMPYDWEKQRATRLDDSDGLRVNFAAGVTNAMDPNRGKSDYGEFKKLLFKMLTALLPKSSFDFQSLVVPVVIVSHSEFMSKNLNTHRDVLNNEVWLKEYLYSFDPSDVTEQDTLLPVSESLAKVVVDLSQEKASRSAANVNDFKRCHARPNVWPVSWILPSPKGPGSECGAGKEGREEG